MFGRANTTPRHRNAPRLAEKDAPGFKQWLRGRECFLAHHKAGGCGKGEASHLRPPVEPAHVDHGGDKGMGTKASDRFAIPLCQRHHDEQHGKVGSFQSRGGWATFQAKYGFNAVDVAGDYWHRWPGRRAWEAKQEQGR